MGQESSAPAPAPSHEQLAKELVSTEAIAAYLLKMVI
jgi:hypothetical protein